MKFGGIHRERREEWENWPILPFPQASSGIIGAPSTDYTTNSTTYEFITAKRFLAIAKDGICSVWRILTKAVYVL